jgi:peptidyl-prolyl cis-trans isomerase D
MGTHPNAQGRIALPMMTSFRRFATSKVGGFVFALILVAFVVTLYEGKSGFGLPGTTGSGLASVGKTSVSEADATRRVQNQLDVARQKNPELDMNAFVASGGVDQTIEQLINGRAFELFAADQGIVASRKLVDGAIASIPAFNGPDGKFDRTTFESILQSRKLSEALVRDDFAREFLTKALLTPVAGAARVSPGLASPYATLMLESRNGQIAAVPTQAFATNTPITDGDITTFYNRNIAAYTVPERRTIKYAVFDRTRFDGKLAPSEAEIAAAYKAAAAKYAGRETRGLTQIIVQSEADANAVLAKVKGGTSMADAARSIGLEALSVPVSDKAAFEKLTGPKVAEAAFAAPRGGFAALSKSGLGYHIVRVDSVAMIAGKSLEAARGEIVAEQTKAKVDQALADFVGQVDDDISGGATFDDIIKKYGLAAAVTPQITASGIAPEQPGFALPEPVKPLLRDAFQAETSDDPQVSSVGNGTAYVLYHMDSVLPAAPRPLAAIKGQVAADAQIDRANKAAKKTADAIAALVNKGTPFAQALASAGVPLPAPKSAGGRRFDIAQAKDKVPAPVMAMFSMPAKRAKVLPVGNGAGWYVVYVDTITPGNPQAAAPLLAGTQQELSGIVGDEYVAQFANAVKANVGVTKNASAIAALKRTLTGQR